jgi:hypothetical protein
MADICRRNNLQGTFLEALPQDIGHPMYVVFDTSLYSYGQMLDTLIEWAGRGQHVAIGTFNPNNKTLILPNDVFR